MNYVRRRLDIVSGPRSAWYCQQRCAFNFNIDCRSMMMLLEERSIDLQQTERVKLSSCLRTITNLISEHYCLRHARTSPSLLTIEMGILYDTPADRSGVNLCDGRCSPPWKRIHEGRVSPCIDESRLRLTIPSIENFRAVRHASLYVIDDRRTHFWFDYQTVCITADLSSSFLFGHDSLVSSNRRRPMPADGKEWTHVRRRGSSNAIGCLTSSAQ
jgi:hypothetical protein